MRNFWVLILLLIFACNQEQTKVKAKERDWSKGHSVSYNKEINEREQLSIALYLEHHKELNVTTTSTGLRVAIIKTE